MIMQLGLEGAETVRNDTDHTILHPGVAGKVPAPTEAVRFYQLSLFGGASLLGQIEQGVSLGEWSTSGTHPVSRMRQFQCPCSRAWATYWGRVVAHATDRSAHPHVALKLDRLLNSDVYELRSPRSRFFRVFNHARRSRVHNDKASEPMDLFMWTAYTLAN